LPNGSVADRLVLESIVKATLVLVLYLPKKRVTACWLCLRQLLNVNLKTDILTYNKSTPDIFVSSKTFWLFSGTT
jgi:hypothetical protein